MMMGWWEGTFDDDDSWNLDNDDNCDDDVGVMTIMMGWEGGFNDDGDDDKMMTMVMMGWWEGAVTCGAALAPRGERREAHRRPHIPH